MPEPANMDVSGSAPPGTYSEPQQALWWLKKGNLKLGPEWDKAHGICQRDEGNPDYDWVHALCHLIEGDDFNTGYWFRRAGRPAHSGSAETLWDEIAEEMQSARP